MKSGLLWSSTMSATAMKKAVSARAHKERSQPAHRTRLGLLEKHKDYVQRAKDFHNKEDRIRKLREKAAARNPDEFYYKMISSQSVKGGVHRQKDGGKQYTEEELLLMRTQDVGYLMNKAQIEQRKVEKLRASHLPMSGTINKHVFFVDDREEAIDVEKKLVGVRPPEPLQVPRVRKKLKRELQERSERAEKLRDLAATMTLKKQLSGKGRKRKLRPEELATPSDQPVYKWRTERKR